MTKETYSGIREIEHRWITMADGIRLSARLWLPAARKAVAVPAILEYIPYRKRDMVRARDERNHPYFARHGYACVRVDMRGSGDSEGLMTDMYAPAELDDAVEVIEWIASQPWCDGSVGMMGTSWGGTASLQAAARRPAALKTVIAVCATDDRFDDDIHHMGGCLLTDTLEWGATLPAILASPPDPATVGPAWRDVWRRRLEHLAFPLEHWVRHQDRDEYWRRGAVSETPDDIACPVLAIGGWADRYSNTVMNMLARGPDRCWGIVGPWGHHFPDVGCPGPGIGFQQEALRWWDHWLRGEDNGIDREPRLRVWLQDYAAPQDRFTLRPGRWVSEPRWPSGNVRSVPMYPGGGRLRSEPGARDETARVPVALEVGRAAGDTGYFGRDGGLPLDQQSDDLRSLVFESDPLEEPLEILGSVRLTVPLSADQPVASLVARLNDAPREGPVARVSLAVRNLALDERGIASREGVRRGSSGVSVVFPNTAYRFARGHRIRLSLSGSYWPLIWPAPVSPRIQLQLRGAQLVLPVRAGGPTGEEISLAEPRQQANPDIEVIAAPRLERSVDTDVDNGRQVIGWHQPLRHVRFDAIDLEFGFETHARHAIDLRDPGSASSRFEHSLHYSRGAWTVDVTGRTAMSSTETAFELSGSVEVRENGNVIYRREWNPVIPRTCS